MSGARTPEKIAILVAAALALGGCRRDEGALYRCSCSFLTDYDDTLEIKVRSCSPSREQADTIARGCAQTTAPAPVQGCVCAVDEARAGVACRAGDCDRIEEESAR
jgi:hypothetical protein